MEPMDAAVATVVALAIAVAVSGFLVWWLGRSYFGRRIWVGMVAAIAAAVAVVVVAHGMMTP